MTFTRSILALVFLALVATGAVAAELPPAPAGYSWVSLSEIKGAFLMPLGWYFKKGRQGDTLGYYITRENIPESGEFLTGLSINVIPDIPEKSGMAPSLYATAFINKAVKQVEVVTPPWASLNGPFEGHGVVLLYRDDQKGDFIVHNLAIANDQTGTLYLITFESPAEAWEKARQIAEPILQRFLIDDTI